jgi:hypothetical protein
VASKKSPASLASGSTVAVILAVALALAFNIFCIAVLYTAVKSDVALSENATQVLTGWGGGIIGILGAYVGYRIGFVASQDDPSDEPDSISSNRERREE